jgi:hypothetical protein
MTPRCQSCRVIRRTSQRGWQRISCGIASAPQPPHYLEAQC